MMSLRHYFFLKLDTVKRGVLKSPESPVSEHLWEVNMLKAEKHCLNLHDSVFVVFFDHSEIISARKLLS